MVTMHLFARVCERRFGRGARRCLCARWPSSDASFGRLESALLGHKGGVLFENSCWLCSHARAAVLEPC